MRLEQLQIFFKTSPSVTLLRSPYAPFLISFFHTHFKVAGRIQVPLSELSAALARFVEDLREDDAYADVLPDKPERYLAEWCAEDKRWLRRLVAGGKDEPVFQLTPHTEAVIAFMDRVIDQDIGFIGTESRLKLVIQTLSELVLGASDDRQARLLQLRQQRAKLDEMIAQLETTAELPQKPAALVKEQFATALGLLKQLLGDFRGVEEKFREITRQVQRRQTDPRESRGAVLGFALDEEDRLKQEDQGVSFHEFLRFILQPAQQERLRIVIEELTRLRELDEMREGMEMVRRMIPLLLAEAEMVMRTNQRLSATLRRLLDRRAAHERQRVAQLLREIRGLAAQCAEAPPQSVEIKVDQVPALFSTFSRTFWTQPTRFDSPVLVSHEVDGERRRRAFADYAKLYGLDWKEMRSRVQQMVQQAGSVKLSDLIARHPLKVGTIEVLGYVQIARDDGHIIQPESTELIVLPASRPGQVQRIIEVPFILFTKTKQTTENNHAD